MKQDLSFLYQLLETESPSGGEQKIAKLFAERFDDSFSIEIDSLNNVICLYDGGAGPVVMLEAHSDEVGLQVTYISDDGFIYFRPNGAIDNQTLQGCGVLIHNKRGDIEGVIGKKPIHIIGDDIDKVPPFEEMWVDICAGSRKEAEEKINVGDLITLKPNIRVIGDYVISKALDDKIGLFIISEAAKQIAAKHTKVKLFTCACAQEETGCRGAKVVANNIMPDYAISVDVGFATDFPGMSLSKFGEMKLGGGVTINHNCYNNREITGLLETIANELCIPIQNYTFLSPSGGSNTSEIQLAGRGVRTALISIPCRYMHTPVEVCCLRDVEAAINLIISYISRLNEG